MLLNPESLSQELEAVMLLSCPCHFKQRDQGPWQSSELVAGKYGAADMGAPGIVQP